MLKSSNRISLLSQFDIYKYLGWGEATEIALPLLERFLQGLFNINVVYNYL